MTMNVMKAFPNISMIFPFTFIVPLDAN